MTQVPGSGRAPRTEAEREAIRAKLRRAGLTCIIAGLVLVAIGLVDALITEERSRIWMILAGIPLSAENDSHAPMRSAALLPIS